MKKTRYPQSSYSYGGRVIGIYLIGSSRRSVFDLSDRDPSNPTNGSYQHRGWPVKETERTDEYNNRTI